MVDQRVVNQRVSPPMSEKLHDNPARHAPFGAIRDAPHLTDIAGASHEACRVAPATPARADIRYHFGLFKYR
jgi:hypothetical protein